MEVMGGNLRDANGTERVDAFLAREPEEII